MNDLKKLLEDDLDTAYELNDAHRTIDRLKEEVDWLKEEVKQLKEENEWLEKQYSVDVDYISYLLRLKTPLPNLIVDIVVKWFKK